MSVACTAIDEPQPQAACALDDFSTSSIDERVWGIYEQPPTTIAQRDGILRASLADGIAAYASVFSVEEIDFRGTSVAVEVVEAPDAVGVEVLLQWVVNNKYRHFIALEAGQLYFGTQDDLDYETGETPYDPTSDRHWRLRHDDTHGRVFYETSADRTSWRVRYESDVLIPLDAAYVELAAGSYEAVAQPGTAAFDNFELAGACTP